MLRLASGVQARARAELAQVSGADLGVCLELAGTARIGQLKGSGQLTRAERLVELFPVALGLLELAVMWVGTVEIVLELTKNARPEVQQALDERLSELLCPLDAVDVRRLVAQTLPELEAELDETAQRWALDFEEIVRAQKVLDDRDGIVRTQAQRRADVFALLPSQLLAFTGAAADGRLAELRAQATLMREHTPAPTPTTRRCSTNPHPRWRRARWTGTRC